MYTSIPITILMATAAIAAPLNINMGAYSPALVVGDGAIEFKSGDSVAGLMTTLEGASVNGAAAAAGGKGGAAPAAKDTGELTSAEAAAPVNSPEAPMTDQIESAAVPTVETEAQPEPVEGMGRKLVVSPVSLPL